MFYRQLCASVNEYHTNSLQTSTAYHRNNPLAKCPSVPELLHLGLVSLAMDTSTSSASRLSDQLMFVGRSNWRTQCHYTSQSRPGGGGGGSAKYDAMRFGPRLATSKGGGGFFTPFARNRVFPKRATGVTLDVHKCVFVHFFVMQKESWGVLLQK